MILAARLIEVFVVRRRLAVGLSRNSTLVGSTVTEGFSVGLSITFQISIWPILPS